MKKYENLHILVLSYANDLVAMCKTAFDLVRFVRTLEKVTQECGLVVSAKQNVYYDFTIVCGRSKSEDFEMERGDLS